MTEELRITAPGITAEEVERGLAAARDVFAGAGATAAEASRASFRRQSLDDCGVFALADAVWRLRERKADPAIVAAAEAELAWLQCQPGMHDLSQDEHKVADVWDRAWWAALKACRPDWAEIAGEFVLEALEPEDAPPPKPEEPANDNDTTFEDQMAHANAWLIRQGVAQGFVTLADDPEAQALTLADLDWYTGAPPAP